MSGYPLAYPVVWSKFRRRTCSGAAGRHFGAPTHVLYGDHP
jgi:hypothetical protein